MLNVEFLRIHLRRDYVSTMQVRSEMRRERMTLLLPIELCK